MSKNNNKIIYLYYLQCQMTLTTGLTLVYHNIVPGGTGIVTTAIIPYHTVVPGRTGCNAISISPSPGGEGAGG
jgi:hypothetical protein